MKTVLNLVGCSIFIGGFIASMSFGGFPIIIGGVICGLLFFAAAHVIELLESLLEVAKNIMVQTETEADKKRRIAEELAKIAP